MFLLFSTEQSNASTVTLTPIPFLEGEATMGGATHFQTKLGFRVFLEHAFLPFSPFVTGYGTTQRAYGMQLGINFFGCNAYFDINSTTGLSVGTGMPNSINPLLSIVPIVNLLRFTTQWSQTNRLSFGLST